MRSRKKRSSEADVTLFPFLAVLICTMGALIVLLVVVVQQARSQAEDIATNKAEAVRKEIEEQAKQRAELVSEMQLELDDFVWQSDLMRESLKATAKQTAEERLRLSGIEDHIRQLRDEIKLAQQSANDLANQGSLSQQSASQTQAVIEDLQGQIATAEIQLQEAKDAIANTPKTYAIVPYDGPNGTKRRPMYIECVADRVIIQPEGIELTSDDFKAPMGPGNPLAAALRAKREYWSNAGLTENSEPYPLLVVRPGGAKAYAASRAAMKAWDAEFGYELVDNEFNLDFLTSTEGMRDVLLAAVDEARIRQEVLRRVAKRKNRRKMDDGVLIPSRNGGFKVVGDNTDTGFGVGSGDKLQDAIDQELSGGGDISSSRAAELGGAIDGKGNFDERFDTEVANSVAGNGGNVPLPFRVTPESNASQASSAQGAQSSPNSQQQTAEYQDVPDSRQNIDARIDARQVPKNVKSLARTRGSNWALPRHAASSTAIRRPVQLVLRNNELVLLPEKGSTEQTKTFRFDNELRTEIDGVVSTVWKRIRDWGVAGSGVYWQPVLHVAVDDRADFRFAELSKLLDNSGLQVKRKLR